MEQRIYRGPVTPDSLADYLVQHYDGQEKLQAQKLGQGDVVMVQVGRGDHQNKVQGAICVGIARVPDGDGVAVTMGQQQWLHPGQGSAVLGSLIGAMFTPWALFGLIWPLSHVASTLTLPNNIWATIEHRCMTVGATLVGTQQLSGVPCAHCGMMNPLDTTTCSTCGQPLNPASQASVPGPAAAPFPATGATTNLTERLCPHCGSVNPAQARFCNQCGTSIV